jgi:type II secretory pathway pseudopilin PulG
MKSNRPSRRPRRGIFLIDAIVGFLLIGVLGLTLVLAITTSSQARRRLDDSAAATVAAEQTLALLRDGQPAPQDLNGAQIKVEAAPGGQEVKGAQWLQVTATRNGRSATLTAFLPKGSAR